MTHFVQWLFKMRTKQYIYMSKCTAHLDTHTSGRWLQPLLAPVKVRMKVVRKTIQDSLIP